MSLELNKKYESKTVYIILLIAKIVLFCILIVPALILLWWANVMTILILDSILDFFKF
jgi:hypothetical protein